MRGIVICGSGIGVDIVANKFAGVRSALAMSADHIRAGRQDDDVNVLAPRGGFYQAGGRARNRARIPFDAVRQKRSAILRRLERSENRREIGVINKTMKVIPVINCPDVECVQKKIEIAKTFLR